MKTHKTRIEEVEEYTYPDLLKKLLHEIERVLTSEVTETKKLATIAQMKFAATCDVLTLERKDELHEQQERKVSNI